MAMKARGTIIVECVGFTWEKAMCRMFVLQPFIIPEKNFVAIAAARSIIVSVKVFD